MSNDQHTQDRQTQDPKPQDPKSQDPKSQDTQAKQQEAAQALDDVDGLADKKPNELTPEELRLMADTMPGEGPGDD